MTFLQQITLHCLACDTRVDSRVAKVAKPRRRIGDDTLATYWFDRVPDEAVDFKAPEYILAAARRQAEEPGEWLS